MGKEEDSRQERSICKGTRLNRSCWAHSKSFRIDAPESVRVRDPRETWLEGAEESDHKEPFRPRNEISKISEAAVGQG